MPSRPVTMRLWRTKSRHVCLSVFCLMYYPSHAMASWPGRIANITFTSVNLFVDVEISHLNTSVTSMPGSKRRCQICGSMKLYKSVGGMVCDQGHVIAGYIREDNQMEDTSRHDMRLRKLRKERKPKKKKSKPRSKGRALLNSPAEAEAKLRERHSCLTSLRWNRG